MDVFFFLIIVSRYKPVEKVVDPRCRSWIHHGMGRIISLFGGDGTMALIMVNKGNHPQMAQQFRLVKYSNLPRIMCKKASQIFSVSIRDLYKNRRRVAQPQKLVAHVMPPGSRNALAKARSWHRDGFRDVQDIPLVPIAYQFSLLYTVPSDEKHLLRGEYL